VALIVTLVTVPFDVMAIVCAWLLGSWPVGLCLWLLGPWIGAAAARGILRRQAPDLPLGWVMAGASAGFLTAVGLRIRGLPGPLWGCFAGAFLAALATGSRPPEPQTRGGRPRVVSAQPRSDSTDSSHG
jgi:hypothetical protein